MVGANDAGIRREGLVDHGSRSGAPPGADRVSTALARRGVHRARGAAAAGFDARRGSQRQRAAALLPRGTARCGGVDESGGAARAPGPRRDRGDPDRGGPGAPGRGRRRRHLGGGDRRDRSSARGQLARRADVHARDDAGARVNVVSAPCARPPIGAALDAVRRLLDPRRVHRVLRAVRRPRPGAHRGRAVPPQSDPHGVRGRRAWHRHGRQPRAVGGRRDGSAQPQCRSLLGAQARRGQPPRRPRAVLHRSAGEHVGRRVPRGPGPGACR